MTQLRPGLHVVRRDDRHLQVGVDPPWRLVVPDEPDVHRLLADLQAGVAPRPTTPAAHRVLRDLLASEMVVHGDDGEPADRTAAAIGVEPAGRPVGDTVRLLRAAGCRVAPPPAADVVILLAGGEVRRALVDAHLRDGRPHLPVVATPAGYRIGPLVVPGVTACVRCVDAHLGEQDPRRAVVVEQVGGREGGAGRDPVLETLVAAWAVRDVLSLLDGGVPSTWSATVEVGTDLSPRRREWTRHPHCGCSWEVEVPA